MARITWKGTFDAAHFIPGHPKCGRLHGHTYQVEVELEGHLPVTEHPIYLVDFAEVKRVVDELDHRLLAPKRLVEYEEEERRGGKARFAVLAYEQQTDIHNLARECHISLPEEQVAVLDIPESSTECLAEYLAWRLVKLSPRLERAKVTIRETPNTGAYAEAYNP